MLKRKVEPVIEVERGVGRPKKVGEHKKLNVLLPAYLIKALKRKALEEEITITDLVAKLLENNIEEEYK